MYKIIVLSFGVLKNTGSEKPIVVNSKNVRLMVSSDSAVCVCKKSRFIEGQEAIGL